MRNWSKEKCSNFFLVKINFQFILVSVWNIVCNYYFRQNEVLNVHLETSESKREKCETALHETMLNWTSLQEDREVREGNYKSQLSTMSEHLANMNEKLIRQTEEIQQLKFELSNKVRSPKQFPTSFHNSINFPTTNVFFFQNGKKGKQKWK